MHAAELARMGARIDDRGLDRGHPRRGVIPGRAGDGLRSARLGRAGAGRAWPRAGARRSSRIYHLDRGYERLENEAARARRPDRAASRERAGSRSRCPRAVCSTPRSSCCATLGVDGVDQDSRRLIFTDARRGPAPALPQAGRRPGLRHLRRRRTSASSARTSCSSRSPTCTSRSTSASASAGSWWPSRASCGSATIPPSGRGCAWPPSIRGSPSSTSPRAASRWRSCVSTARSSWRRWSGWPSASSISCSRARRCAPTASSRSPRSRARRRG